MKLNITVIIIVLVMGTGVALGQGLPEGSGSVDVFMPVTNEVDDMVVWCQEWSGCFGGWTSQIDQGDLGADSECVDDFISGTDYAVTSVVWWGGTLAEHTLPDFFNITFYGSLDGDCSQPDTGNILSQQTIMNFNPQLIDAGPFYTFSASFDPVLMDAGQKYWISIRAVLTVVDTVDGWSTQWFWAMNEETLECPGLVNSEYWETLGWVPLDVWDPDYACGPAFAFCLYSDMAVATEASSWGSVKTLFR